MSLTDKTYSDVDDALDRIAAALASARQEFAKGGKGSSANSLAKHFENIERAALDAYGSCEWDFDESEQ